MFWSLNTSLAPFLFCFATLEKGCENNTEFWSHPRLSRVTLFAGSTGTKPLLWDVEPKIALQIHATPQIMSWDHWLVPNPELINSSGLYLLYTELKCLVFLGAFLTCFFFLFYFSSQASVIPDSGQLPVIILSSSLYTLQNWLVHTHGNTKLQFLAYFIFNL